MATVIRRLETVTLSEKRREILHTVGWQVSSAVWCPPTDVYETDQDYVVRVEIAVMREEDFEVTIENGSLRISGFRPDVPERRAYHQMEIRFGKFSTVINIPGPIDADRAEARYEDGFLMVRLPKAKASEVKKED